MMISRPRFWRARRTDRTGTSRRRRRSRTLRSQRTRRSIYKASTSCHPYLRAVSASHPCSAADHWWRSAILCRGCCCCPVDADSWNAEIATPNAASVVLSAHNSRDLDPVYTIKQTPSNHRANIQQMHLEYTCTTYALIARRLLDVCFM